MAIDNRRNPLGPRAKLSLCASGAHDLSIVILLFGWIATGKPLLLAETTVSACLRDL
jgi:hypothetical protein